MQMMIPKKIHYCWFGRNPLDEKALRCIESWKRFFPGYEIIQWNEDNLDVQQHAFMAKAYADKKWAFVSDVARLKVIYDHGGIYFDTDVEVVASFEDILSDDAEGFLGYEKTGFATTGGGFGAIAGQTLIGKMLAYYDELDYDQYRERLSEIACPLTGTKVLMEHGFVSEDRMQQICGLNIYASEFFSPLNYYTGKMEKTRNTHAIHWYSDSWNSEEDRRQRESERRMNRIFGRRIAGTLMGIASCVRQEGVAKYVKARIKKVLKGQRMTE